MEENGLPYIDVDDFGEGGLDRAPQGRRRHGYGRGKLGVHI